LLEDVADGHGAVERRRLEHDLKKKAKKHGGKGKRGKKK
jgi:hypothetical protein